MKIEIVFKSSKLLKILPYLFIVIFILNTFIVFFNNSIIFKINSILFFVLAIEFIVIRKLKSEKKYIVITDSEIIIRNYLFKKPSRILIHKINSFIETNKGFDLLINSKKITLYKATMYEKDILIIRGYLSNTF